MTSGRSNYGTRLKTGAGFTTDIGEVTNIDFPELRKEAVEATNFGSGGWREFVSSGLAEVSEFTATINFTGASGSTLTGNLINSASALYQVQFPNDLSTKWTFIAWVTGFKPVSADAMSPESLTAEVKFQPSGSCVIS